MEIEKIRKMLSDRNLAEVARRMHVTRSYLSAIACGKKTPSKNMTARLLDYLEGNNANP